MSLSAELPWQNASSSLMAAARTLGRIFLWHTTSIATSLFPSSIAEIDLMWLGIQALRLYGCVFSSLKGEVKLTGTLVPLGQLSQIHPKNELPQH